MTLGKLPPSKKANMHFSQKCPAMLRLIKYQCCNESHSCGSNQVLSLHWFKSSQSLLKEVKLIKVQSWFTYLAWVSLSWITERCTTNELRRKSFFLAFFFTFEYSWCRHSVCEILFDVPNTKVLTHYHQVTNQYLCKCPVSVLVFVSWSPVYFLHWDS